jgi:hypothetical protein
MVTKITKHRLLVSVSGKFSTNINNTLSSLNPKKLLQIDYINNPVSAFRPKRTVLGQSLDKLILLV